MLHHQKLPLTIWGKAAYIQKTIVVLPTSKTLEKPASTFICCEAWHKPSRLRAPSHTYCLFVTASASDLLKGERDFFFYSIAHSYLHWLSSLMCIHFVRQNETVQRKSQNTSKHVYVCMYRYRIMRILIPLKQPMLHLCPSGGSFSTAEN